MSFTISNIPTQTQAKGWNYIPPDGTTPVTSLSALKGTVYNFFLKGLENETVVINCIWDMCFYKDQFHIIINYVYFLNLTVDFMPIKLIAHCDVQHKGKEYLMDKQNVINTAYM